MMSKHEKINWFSNLLTKIFVVTVFLQSSFGFDIIEDDYSAVEPGLSQYVEEGLWNILMKLPRGYMVPMPRVGRRHIHKEQKRQNMIPQPRIGRQLDFSEGLAEILQEIQKFLLESRNSIPDVFYAKTYPEIYDNRKNSDENRKSDGFESDKATDRFHLSGDIFKNVEEVSNDNHDTGIAHSNNNERKLLKSEAMNSGFNYFDEARRQTLIPLSQLSRSNLLTLLSGENLDDFALASPHFGRKNEWYREGTMIPYPRAGRFIDPESVDYDILLNVDSGLPELESISDSSQKNQPIIHKRRNLKLIPRIGRKKRSISDEVGGNQENDAENYSEVSKSEDGRHITDMLDDFNRRYFLPDDKRTIRKNARFNPRIGKKSSDDLEEYFEEKRAKAFTPRIGRAALIPRIGRNDPRFRLKNRAFIPRIGRRAALIPRIGRSENSENQNSEIN